MRKRERTLKVIIGKTGLDGHWRGVQAVATALRDAGMEVVYVGTMPAEALVQSALQEDADVIGLNVGASYEQVEILMAIMKDKQIKDVLVIVGGVIPLADIPKLMKMGVKAVYPPGSKLSDIVDFVQKNGRLLA